jgi:serine/threonine-protein kinase
MGEAFEREKAVEDGVLAELLRGTPALIRPLTEKEMPTFAPPTALAFEHRALDAPPDFVPSAEVELLEDPASGGTDSAEPGSRPTSREVRVAFDTLVHDVDEGGEAQVQAPPPAPAPPVPPAPESVPCRCRPLRLAKALAHRGAVPRRARGGLPRGVAAGVNSLPVPSATREFRSGPRTFTE